MCHQYRIYKWFQWLENNPIPNEYKEELKYIECKWLKMKQFFTEVIEKNKHQKNSGEATALKKKWDTNMPWLHLFLCFTVDCVKEAFLLCHQAMNREELEALNTFMQQSDYRDLVIDLFNDPDWIPCSTESLPDLHDDFEIPFVVLSQLLLLIKKMLRIGCQWQECCCKQL